MIPLYRRYLFVSVLLSFVVASLIATVADAESSSNSNLPRTFRCETIWSGPSADNDVEQCAKEQDLDRWKYGFMICGVPALMLALLIVVYPVFFVCRQCCNFCGGRHRQPGVCCSRVTGFEKYEPDTQFQKDTFYEHKQINRVRVAAFLVFIGTIFVLVFMVHSVSEMRESAEHLIDAFLSQTVDYFVQQYDMLTTALRDPSDQTKYVSPVQEDYFRSVNNFISDIREFSEDYREDYEPIVTVHVRIGLTVFAFAPFILLFLTPLYASRDRCTSFWPSCTTCVYCFGGFLFSIVAILAFILGLAFTATCGEVEEYHAGNPGAINWLAVPYCEEKRIFDDLHTNLANGEAAYATQYCMGLTNICNSNPIYNPLTPKLVYVCSWDNSTAASRCPDLINATATVSTMTVKTGANPCSSSPANCNVTVCASNCTNANVKQVAQNTAAIRGSSQQFYTAKWIVAPWLSCQFVIDRLVIGLDNNNCVNVRDTTWKVGIACVVGAFLFCVGIVVLFKGQKLFFKKRDVDSPLQDSQNAPTTAPEAGISREWYEPSSV